MFVGACICTCMYICICIYDMYMYTWLSSGRLLGLCVLELKGLHNMYVLGGAQKSANRGGPEQYFIRELAGLMGNASHPSMAQGCLSMSRTKNSTARF